MEAGNVMAADAVTVSEADDGRSIHVAPGTQVQLVLHSTYWQPMGSSETTVLAPKESARTEADRKACLPGGGCGTITQSFAALKAGQASLSAQRKVCGEALPCPPDRQRFEVTIVVAGRGDK